MKMIKWAISWLHKITNQEPFALFLGEGDYAVGYRDYSGSYKTEGLAEIADDDLMRKNQHPCGKQWWQIVDLRIHKIVKHGGE